MRRSTTRRSDEATDNVALGHEHFSHRAPWLRASVLGAIDGLGSVAALLLGVEGGSGDRRVFIIAGTAAAVSGAFSMAVSEYVSMSSQRDAEVADVQKEIQEQAKGPEARKREQLELEAIYAERGLSKGLAAEVARELTAHDVIRAHARDELGLNIDELSSPLLAAVSSFLSFSCGSAIPLLSCAFIEDASVRTWVGVVVAAVGFVIFGAIGAALGGARILIGAMRVLVGGMAGIAITYGVGLGVGMAFT